MVNNENNEAKANIETALEMMIDDVFDDLCKDLENKKKK